MFYLKELLLIIRDHKVLSIANLALLVLFVGVIQHKSDIRSFFSLDSKTTSAPYFNALVSAGSNPDAIARKIGNLPGVAKVELRNSSKLEKEIGGFLKGLGAGEDLLAGGFNSFKVVLDKSTRPESRQLIREYFSRLVGKKDVTFSEVKTSRSTGLKASPLYSLFAKWSDTYIAALAGFGWLFTLWLLSQPIQAQGFVIERFQRKDKTALKMYFWLWMIPVAAFFAVAIAIDLKVGLLDLAPVMALLVLGAVLFAKKGSSPRRFI